MNWLRNKTIFNFVLSIGCGLSMLLSPGKAMSQEFAPDCQTAPHCCEAPVNHCCEAPCNPCCEENSCCMLGSRTSGVIFAGALLAGAVAIAASNSHDDGSTGPKGSSGSVFDSNSGETITFFFDSASFENTGGDTIPITLTPFVISPDGRFFFGDPSNLTLNPGVNTYSGLGLIQVEDPIFGAYHAGVQLRNNSTENTVSIVNNNLSVTVGASGRPDTEIEEYDSSTPPVLVVIGGDYQIQADYGYAEEIVP